jgi:MFS family permease
VTDREETAVATATRPHAAARRRPAISVGSRRHEAGFWMIAATFMAAMAFSTVPTPLYPLYQARDGFSSFMVTVVFAVYAVGVATSLMLAGQISDWIGRRKVLVPALLAEILAGVLFIAWRDHAGLLVARLITGLGVGLVTGTATAYLVELQKAARPKAGQGRFEIVSTFANIGGLGAGPLIAGALVQYVAHPLTIPYVVLGGSLIVGLAAIAASPETVKAPDERFHYRPQRVRLHLGTGAERTTGLAALAGAFAAFAIFGLFTSLAPGFVGGTLHHSSHLLDGFTAFLVFGAAVIGQLTTAALDAHQRFALGLVLEATGLIVLVVGTEAAQLITFLAGGALAGAGGGVLFKVAIGTIAGLAPEEKRGEALAGLFLTSYVGLIIPAVGVGVLTLYLSTQVSMLCFGAVLIAVLGIIGALRFVPGHAAEN